MDDRDIFAIISLIGGFITVFLSYARTAAALNFKPDDKKPTFLWGELRSENAKFTYYGWVVSAIVTAIGFGSSFICIYYYVQPYSWWLLNAATITLFVGAFSWYDLTRIVWCHKVRDLAAVPVLLVMFGNGIMLVTLVHPDSGPLDPTKESDNVAYRMVLVMLAFGFFHHLVMDLFVWYFSFVFMDVENSAYCESSFETVDTGLRKRGLKKMIGSQRRADIQGLAC